MKNKILSVSHIEPYLKGKNYFRYEAPTGERNASGDIMVGKIEKISVEHSSPENTRISFLAITAEWLVRIHEVVDIGQNGQHTHWQYIQGSLKRKYLLKFEKPHLIRERGPLKFVSEGEFVEITHFTDLAKLATDIEVQLNEALNAAHP